MDDLTAEQREPALARELADTKAELARTQTDLESARAREGELEATSKRVRKLVLGIAGVFLVGVIGVAFLVAYVLDLKQVQDEQAADDLQDEQELDERRFNACVDAREQAIADNAQREAQIHTEEASIAGFQADIDLVGALLAGVEDPDVVLVGEEYLAAKQAVIASKVANIAAVSEGLENLRVCTTEGIEAFGEGRPEAFEPPTQVASG